MRERVVLCLVVLALFAPRARADEIVVPPLQGNSGSCWPFGCGLRIQTVFDAALFPSAMRIDALKFFNTTEQSAETGAEPATYRFSLSTTSTSSATLGLNMSGNVGANNRQVAEWTISDWTFFTTLTLPATSAFVYNPFDGNLLLDIQKNRTENAGDGPIYANVNTDARGVATAIDEIGPNHEGGNSGPLLARGVAVNVGLEGSVFGPPFNGGGAPAPTPEPASLLLIGSGAAAVFARQRKREGRG